MFKYHDFIAMVSINSINIIIPVTKYSYLYLNY